MDRSSRISAVAGATGLVLLVAGIAVLWAGVRDDHSGLSVLGILAAVLGLAGLRVRGWIRRERALRRVGEDLHVPRRD